MALVRVKCEGFREAEAPMFPNRRDFLFAAGAAAAAARFGRSRLGAQAQEAPPETTTQARQGAEPLRHAAVRRRRAARRGGYHRGRLYREHSGPLLSEAIASGQIDFAMHFSGPLVLLLDRGRKVTMLAGVHVGCFELFAKDGIRSVADLKGRSVGTPELESSAHVFISAMAALVGLDPAKDINWVTARNRNRSNCSSTARSTPFSAFRPSRSVCGRKASAT